MSDRKTRHQERVPAVCYVCKVVIGNFVVDKRFDDTLSLPPVMCNSCKRADLLERGLI